MNAKTVTIVLTILSIPGFWIFYQKAPSGDARFMIIVLALFCVLVYYIIGKTGETK